MLPLKKLYGEFSGLTTYVQDISLLLARLTIAYGFYDPAMKKWSNMENVASWFGSLGIPMPTLNAYLAATTELLGVILLSLGLMTRLISVPLVIVMIVAIFTVHIGNGFSAGDNGFEIPLYYMLFLLIFMSHGPGKFSIDRYLFDKE
jgi:putative oxidoreductase